MTGARYTPAGVYQPDFWTVGSHDFKYHHRVGSSNTTINTAWVANLGVWVPVQLDVYCTVYEWWWVNGTLTTAHNVDFGLYNEDFTKIQTLGATAGATTASVLVNTSTWANLVVAPGNYYMAFSDSSTRNFICSADALGIYASSGCFEQSSVGTLPATATPVLYNRAFLPLFGMHMMTVVP